MRGAASHKPFQSRGGRPARFFFWLVTGFNVVLVVGAGGLFLHSMLPFARSVGRIESGPVPAAMEEVDWHNSGSSVYCLACHRDVARAVAGRDVECGHPQNVRLSEAQLLAIQEMGTVIGPDDTLICMSCHKLDPDPRTPFMLADTLAGSSLCIRCHPEHAPQGENPHDLRMTAPDERNRLGQTAHEGGPCSACHLAHRYARVFRSSELDPEGRCVTCHEPGRAAEGLVHQRMEHPETRCTECHDPHNGPGGSFLKLAAADLCITCHEEHALGPAVGMHPVGLMDRAIPRELVEAGAQAGEHPHHLTCTVCHSTHSSRYSPLLLLAPDSNDLCLACHREELTQLGPGGTPTSHGLSPLLTSEQQAVVRARGGLTGPGGELLCVSCHRVHGGAPVETLLLFSPAHHNGCAACHPEQAAIVTSPHDLRISAPHETNVTGLSALAGGPCSACHTAHQPGRLPRPTAGDADGRCMSCHHQDGCAGSKFPGVVMHPETQCSECHTPHDNSLGHYLVAREADLCLSCHEDQGRLAGGPHDVSLHPLDWPEAARSSGTLCLPCHLPHGDHAGLIREQAQGRSRTASVAGDPDAACLSCHPDAGWHVPSPTAAIHPREVSPAPGAVLPLAVDDEGKARMECRTCHDPHGAQIPIHLIRTAQQEPAHQLCLHCHPEKEYIRLTGHSPERLAALGFVADACQPCHAMHAHPQGAWGQMLSPRFLLQEEQEIEGPEGPLPCLACHHAGGPAPIRDVATHPPLGVLNVIPPDAPGYLPLFNAEGKVDERGEVTCRTCHLSHGRIDLLKLLEKNLPLDPQQQRAMHMQLRPFIPPNVCTECHGAEARLRFLLYHDPNRGEILSREKLRTEN